MAGLVTTFGNVENRGHHTWRQGPTVVPVLQADLPLTADQGTILTVSDDAASPMRVFLGSAWVSIPNTSSLGGDWYQQEWTPTPGQTLFTLAHPVLLADSFSFRVNGIEYDEGGDYTRVDQVVTWLDTLFVLETSDRVSARYLKG